MCAVSFVCDESEFSSIEVAHVGLRRASNLVCATLAVPEPWSALRLEKNMRIWQRKLPLFSFAILYTTVKKKTNQAFSHYLVPSDLLERLSEVLQAGVNSIALE